MNKRGLNLYPVRAGKFLQRVRKNILRGDEKLSAEYCVSDQAFDFSGKPDSSFLPVSEGDIWGKEWQSAWFRITGKVPKEWRGEKVVAELDFNGEAMVFSNEGMPLQGLCTSSIFDETFSRTIFSLHESCRGGENVSFRVEAVASSMFGIFLEDDPEPDDPKRFGYFEGKVNRMRLRIMDHDLWQFALDFEILLNLAENLAENSVRKAKIMQLLNAAIEAYADNRENAPMCREILSEGMRKPAHASDLTAFSIGHAHIDTAWLWPVSETVRKCARTFSTQVSLMEKYPDYIFGASQAQQYYFIRKYYPALYDRIKKLVKKGQWEILGGMWVEADCNLISPESMIRQILHGKNFFKDEFGAEITNLWLPDVFGYSGAMPQIMKKSGLDFFLTQKLSWNQYNKFPHHTFQWQGIDGSAVIAHFPPEDTYNSPMTTKGQIFARDNFIDKDVCDEYLCLFGVGDGGGGPDENHIERGMRMRDLEGCPKVRFSRADDFFERTGRRKDSLKTWVGELYFETHRGTLTTQALVKRFNRELENKLRAMEFLFSCLPLRDYPGEEMDRIWKQVLLHQFHDIIPGSSINRVYTETHAAYRDVSHRCDTLLEKTAFQLFERSQNGAVLFNSLPYDIVENITMPSGWKEHGVVDANGTPLPVQKEGEELVAQVSIPAYSFVNLEKSAQPPNQAEPGRGLQLENDLISYEFDKKGLLVKAWDKEARRDILASGASGNVFSLYEDRPNDLDAWDIDIFYEQQKLEEARVVSIENLPGGPVRQGVRFIYSVGDSQISQNVYLGRNSRRLDFVTTVDWRERHRMLRVAFPVNVMNDKASFDIQYGYIERSTHRNTSWDMARFESCAHRYVDLSRDDYGVALLNNCKYGHKAHMNILDLALLRSPSNPDPDADKGAHEFTYSLFPHKGNLTNSNVMIEAASLNNSPLIFDGMRNTKTHLPCGVEGKGLSLEVLKRAEKEDCLVLRVVETLGRNSSGKIIVRKPGSRLVETDLMEWTSGRETVCKGSTDIHLAPFEIRTYKLIQK